MRTINDLLNRLTGLQNDLPNSNQVNVTINANVDGMIEKECFNSVCSEKFYVHVEDWENICRDEEVFCPICSQAAEAKEFNSSTYADAVKNELDKGIRERLLGSGAPLQIDGLVIDTLDKAESIYSCKECQTRYGTNTDARVCPSCGTTAIKPS